MESQLQHPLGHTNDEDPHNTGLELHSVVEDDPHEKKSVLKKVMDKAKKIKGKLQKDGHGHEHEHEKERHYTHHDYDGYEEDDDEDQDEQMVEDPEVHGAPLYEPFAIRSSVPAQTEAVNLEKPTAEGEDRYDDTKRADRMEEDIVDLGQERPKICVSGGLEVDPHAPKSPPGKIPPANYESKVTDPLGEGGKEVDLNPLIGSFVKMGVSEETPGMESEQRGYTGSHDHFAPQENPTEGEFSPITSKSDSVTGKSSDQSGYVQKLSVAMSTVADKAISAKNAVASKLGYGGTEGDKGQETKGSTDGAAKSGASASASPTENVQKVAAIETGKLAPVYEKVAGAGSSSVSKVKGSGAGNEATEISGGPQPDKGLSVKEFLAEKLKPGEEDKALSEVISDTLHKKKGGLVKAGESKPTGKVKTIESNRSAEVTESEEVARHLGSGMENKREGDDAIAAGRESSGSGMLDRLKGAVSSWIGKGGEQQYSKGSLDAAYVSNEGTSATAEVERQPGVTDQRRLQESVN